MRRQRERHNDLRGAPACGLKLPIKKKHPAYKCMTDWNGGGVMCGYARLL